MRKVVMLEKYRPELARIASRVAEVVGSNPTRSTLFLRIITALN
jgi:hypothetical protein